MMFCPGFSDKDRENMLISFDETHRVQLGDRNICLVNIDAKSCFSTSDLFVNAVNNLLTCKGIEHKMRGSTTKSSDMLVSPCLDELFCLSTLHLQAVTNRKSNETNLVLLVTYGECIKDCIFSDFISELHQYVNSRDTGYKMHVSVVSMFSSCVSLPLQMRARALSQVEIIKIHHSPPPIYVLEDVLTSVFTNSMFPFSLSNGVLRRLLTVFRGHHRCVWTAVQRYTFI